MAEDINPMLPSADYAIQEPYWCMVNSILGGAETMRKVKAGAVSVSGPTVPVSNLQQLYRGMRSAESPYLPKFPNENDYDYELRLKHAPFTNIYDDISKNLASKPFSKECQLSDDAPEDLKTLSANVDGQGHNLHMFASDAFKSALDKGTHWIMVDYTQVPPQATLADERTLGARPYWIHIPAERMLAVYSDFVAGQEIIHHARIHEPVVKLVGYGESLVQRVRVLSREPIVNALNKVIAYGPPTWELWELVEESSNQKKTWVMVDAGVYTIDVLPLVPVIIGERKGQCWQVEPALRNLAYMQVEEFQQESNLKTIKELTAFPMISGNGVTPPVDADGKQMEVPVGPRAVLFAPMGSNGEHGEWTYIEPTAASLTFLQADLEKFRTEMRDLGMQPMASANLTVITTANQAMRAHSQVQAWTLRFKDALEQAWVITAKWLEQDLKPEVKIHTDFGVDFEAGTELDALQKARDARVISNKLHFDELKRRGVLSDEANYEADQEEVAAEDLGQQLTPEKLIDPVTGAPVVATPVMGTPNPPPAPNKQLN